MVMKQELELESLAPSPTPTPFSGIPANYEQSKGGEGTPGLALYSAASRTHYIELRKYLLGYLERAPPGKRTIARSRLARLTGQQFHELSTDVCDDLARRKAGREVPFLPVDEALHPKRNQARQKLSMLIETRFEDLCSDVYFELSRRYPASKNYPAIS